MRVAILGAGAMGSLIGSFLGKSGMDVTLIDPYREHMDNISNNGLKVILNGKEENITLKTSYTPKGVGKVNVLIVLVKGMYTAEALKSAEELIEEDTYVLTLQNGIGNDDVLCEYVEESHVLKGVMKIASQLLEPGVIQSTTMNGVTALYLGTMNNNKESIKIAKLLVNNFNKVNIQAEYKGDIDKYIWSKAVNNISINAICAICRTNITNYCNHPEGRKILEKCIKEVIEVAKARGVQLDFETVISSIENNTIPKIGKHLPSTAQDVKNKRKTEIDYLNGAISRYGYKFNINTPVNDITTGIIKVIEDNYSNMF